MCVYRAAGMVCLPFARLLAMAEGLFDRFWFWCPGEASTCIFNTLYYKGFKGFKGFGSAKLSLSYL